MLLLLIDGLNLIRRVHAAVPGNVDEASHFDAAQLAITRSVTRALEFHAPSHVACVMDPRGKTWRHELYPEYKQGRTPMPEALQLGLDRVINAISELRVMCLTINGFEADDVIATLAHRVATHKGQVTILSTDSKFCQLLGPGISVYDHFRRLPLGGEFCQQRFGVPPSQLRDWFSLVGDSSLNLRGVNGVGAKTATKLLNDYGTLAQIYAHVDEIQGSLHNKLANDKTASELAYELLGFPVDVDVGINLNQLRYQSAP